MGMKGEKSLPETGHADRMDDCRNMIRCYRISGSSTGIGFSNRKKTCVSNHCPASADCN
jgi:hypothetical protein